MNYFKKFFQYFPVFLIAVLVLGFSYDTVRATDAPTIVSVSVDGKVGIDEKAAIMVVGTVPIALTDTVVYATITDSATNVAVGATSTPIVAGATTFSILVDGTSATAAALVDGNLTVTVTGNDGSGFATSTNFIVTQETVRPTFSAKRTSANTIVLTFDENVSASDTSTAAWTLSDGSVTAATQPADVNTLTLTTSGISTITATPTVTYVAVSGSVVDSYGNEVGDGVNAVAADFVAPTLTQVTAVPTFTNDTTPNYTFSSDKAGTITYAGDCSSGDTAAIAGNTTVTFNALGEGTHANCTIKVTDGNANESLLLAVNSFSIDLTPPTFTASRTDINTIVLTFNELVTATTSAANAWTVSGATIDAASQPNEVLTLTLTSSGLTGTLETPSVNYVQVNGAVSDLAGNGVADGGNVTATDGVAPILLSAVVRSDNASSTLAKVGDILTLYATSSEPIALPTVTIAGQGATEAFVGVSTTEFTATFTMTGGQADGLVDFTVDFADAPVGNPGVQVVLPTDGIKVRFDKTAPSLVFSLPFADSFVRGESLITFTNSETTTPQCSVTGGALTVCTTGVTTLADLNNFAGVGEGASFTLTLTDTDLAGNETTITRTLTKDTQAPTKPDAPTAAAGPMINDAEEAAGFVVVVPLGTSGALAGDTLELLLGGTSFPTPITATLSATDISNTSHSFTVVANQLGADGVKSITARVTDQANNLGASSDPLALTLDTVAPTITSVTSSTASGSYKAGVAIPVTVIFSEEISSAGGVTLTFNSTGNPTCTTASIVASTTGACTYTIAGGQTSADLDATVTGTVTDAAGNTLTNFTPAATLASAKDIVVDTTEPTVVSVTTIHPDGFYNASTTIDFSVLLSEPVIVTGLPKIGLNTGSLGTNYATYLSGSGTNTLTLRYTVDTGHNSPDLDYDNTASFGSAGDIADLAGNNNGGSNPVLPAPSIAGLHAIVIDTIAPLAPDAPTAAVGPLINASEQTDGVVVVVPLGTSGAVEGDTVTLLRDGVNFPTPLTHVLIADEITAGSYTFTVASPQLGTDGAKNITARITDKATNAGVESTALALTLDSVAPIISSVTTTTASGSYKAGEEIVTTVTFSEAVSSAGVTLTFNTTGSVGTCTTGAITNATTGACTYTVGVGETSADLDATVSGATADTAGNPLTNFTPVATLASAKDIIIDTTAPLVSSVTTAHANGFYSVGTEIEFAVAFPETVLVTSGIPELQLNSGGGIAYYVSGSNSDTLTFRYTVGSGHTSVDLDYALATSLTGNVTDIAGNTAPLTLADPGAIAAGHNIVIDTTAPTASPAPTADASPLINAAEHTAGVFVGASLSGTGAVEGDTLELLLGGSSFPAPITRVITSGDLTDTFYVFTVASGQLGADGIKSVTSRVTDQASNVGAESPALSLTLDTIAPAAPSVTSIATDNKINNNEKAAITVLGTAEANALVSLTLTDASGNSKTGGQQLTGGATAFAITLDGTTATPGAFVDGVVTPSVTATDAAGNTSTATVTPSALKDTVAPPAPIITFTDPVNIASVTSSALSGSGEGDTAITATTTDGTLNVVTTGTVSSLGVISLTAINLSTLSDGTLTTSVVLTDSAGNISAVTSAASTKDTVIPDFSSLLPGDSSYINNVTNASDLGYTLSEALSAGTVTFTRTSGAADASSPRVCTLAGTAKNSGAHTLDLSDTANGCATAISLVDGATYSIDFDGIDLYGNTAATDTSINVRFDATNPTVTISNPLPGSSTATEFTFTSATDETATCALVLDGSTMSMTTGGTAHTRVLSGLSQGLHTQAVSCTDLADNTTLTSTQNFTVLATSGTTVTATSTNAVFDSVLDGQADLPSGINALTFSNTTVLDVSPGVSTASAGSVTIGGVVQSLGSITAPDLVGENLSTPRTIGDQTFTIEKAVRLNSGVSGEGSSDPIVLTNNTLSGISLSIPDDTVVFGPAAWDGTIQPGRIVTTTGTPPPGMVVSDTLDFGSSQNLIFSKPVTIVTPRVSQLAMKPAGSDGWTAVSTCAGTFASPVNPTFAGECAIVDQTLGTKIVTYHLTSFASLDAAPVSLGANGPVFTSPTGGGGGGGGGFVSQLSFGVPPQAAAPAVSATSAVVSSGPSGAVLGVSTFRFTKPLFVGLRNNDVKELQKILIAEGLLKSQATGYYGPLTRAAVIKWQKKNDIAPAIGIIGPLSRAVLNKPR